MGTGSLLVTGASGFVGRAIVERALTDGWVINAATRTTNTSLPNGMRVYSGLELNGATDWNRALYGVDTVIHAAARVHVMSDSCTDPLGEFRRTNVDGTLRLARQAADARVRRFVFLSSIKVNGESTPVGAAFRSTDTPKPCDPYGISKFEAENALRVLGRDRSMEVVVIRPVLVYGPGVKGNFLAMMQWVSRGLPLPLAAARNSRSLVALDNLIDLVMVVAQHPCAANQTFLVSDGNDLSTPELLRRLGQALGRETSLFAVPPFLVKAGARMVGKGEVARRLLSSLRVDISSTSQTLGWTPRITVDEGLRTVAGWYLSQTR